MTNHQPSKSGHDGGRTNRLVKNDAMTQAEYYAFVEKHGRTPGDYASIFDDTLGSMDQAQS
jgi:hypothetical protein